MVKQNTVARGFLELKCHHTCIFINAFFAVEMSLYHVSLLGTAYMMYCAVRFYNQNIYIYILYLHVF